MDKAKRKALTNTYKLAFPPMGIYIIKNTVTGKQLIGKSTNVTGTLNRHQAELRLGTHRNPRLLADWKQYGETHFIFEMLEPIKERPEPGFDYAGELDECLAVWQTRTPKGSPESYL